MTFREEVQVLRRIYDLLGPLKRMLAISLLLTGIYAAWTAVVLSALGLFLQVGLGSLRNDPAVTGTPAVLSVLQPALQALEAISPTHRVLICFTLFGLAMIISSLLKVAVYAYNSLFSTRFIYQLREQVFRALSQTAQPYFDVHKKGELMQMVIQETKAHFTIVRCLTNALMHVSSAVVAIGFAITLSWQLCLLVGALWLVLLAENRWLNRKVMALSHTVTDKLRELMVITEETLGGIKHLKLLNFTRPIVKRFARTSWDSDFLDRRGKIWIQLQEAFSMTLGLICLMAVVGLNTGFGWLSASALILFIYILYRVLPMMSGVNHELSFVIVSFPMARRVIAFLDLAELNVEKSGTAQQTPLLATAIEYRGVKLDYPMRKGVLQDVSFSIPRGQMVALVGPSGSGKTSIANLLVRLYDYSGGDILIDGRPLPEWDLHFLRTRIGMVSQETTIFNMTVRDNLLLARPDSTIDEMDEACRKAFALDFIRLLPEGYDTLLGDRGVQLSGGQRQRLQLAQIFLKDPEILILDEATSALDSESEAIVQRALQELAHDRTSLVIAHRLSTIRHADLIVVVEQGRVAETGDWESLYRNKGRFFHMIQRHNIDVVDDMQEVNPA